MSLNVFNYQLRKDREIGSSSYYMRNSLQSERHQASPLEPSLDVNFRQVTFVFSLV